MEQKYGYIYIRNHESYDVYDACKLGKASNIPERDSQYATGEIKRGHFDPVFEVPIETMGHIERLLQEELCEFNIKFDAGTEFYKKTIVNDIEHHLIKHNILYKKLTKEEIDNLVRLNRPTSKVKKIKIKPSKRTVEKKEIISYEPRHYQQAIIEKSVSYFQTHNKGILALICGVGKTLISLWITQALKSNTILIGVYNKLLLEQWVHVVNSLFKSVACLMVSDGVFPGKVTEFLENNKNKCIVITTYASSHKVYDATKNTGFVFDMKINDEAHHLTTKDKTLANDMKSFIKMLEIPSVKQVSLTATLKLLENACDDVITISNDNVEYFGEVIDRKCLLWAINERIVCDYVIQTFVTDEDQIEEYLMRFHIVEENDKSLFLSAIASLKSINEGHSHHLLIYTNSTENSAKIIQYIELLLDNNYFELPDLYYSYYHSKINKKDRMGQLSKFEKAAIGIISCVYCLGEGWDFPLLDGVVFSENMDSKIRILQSALRPIRKNKNDEKKICKIILPILNRDDWLENNDNSDLKKVREVIYEMGLEDETITQKIKVFKLKNVKNNPKKDSDEKTNVDEFGEYDDELTQKLRLKTVKRTALATTYEKAKKIIAEKNVKSKEEYYELCERDIRLSPEPEIVFKGQFTNWIDYLSIKRIYYDIDTCRHKVGEYLSQYPKLSSHYLDLSVVCRELCKIDALFPPNELWVEYYNVKNLGDIITIKPKKKKSGAIF